MLPLSVASYRQRLDAALPQLRVEVGRCSLPLQHVFSNYLIIKAAGLVELGVQEIVGAYSLRHGNGEIQSFVRTSVSRENALNCEKIERILAKFSLTWWPSIEGATSSAERSAVDSLKTLRDQVAHGGYNGTGFATVEGYYVGARRFIEAVSNELLP